MTIAIIILSGCIFLTLPYWLPSLVIRLRMFIFTKVNGEEGIQLPNERIGASKLKCVYSHKNADGRSQGAELSNLFWYWLSPTPEIHQEHIEKGEKYNHMSTVTNNVLSVPTGRIEALAEKCATRFLSEKYTAPWRVTRLRDMMMPIWAEFYYELVFDEECPDHARQLIVDNANDVIEALKCCSLRHMRKRDRLTQFLIKKLRGGEFPHQFPGSYSLEERASFLQGVFFNTAIVQTSEAMAHLLLTLAQHPEVQEALANNERDAHYYDMVITETLRLFPLFGVAHRITSDDIVVDEQTVIPRGSVVCFNYSEYQSIGYEQPEKFIPERWQNLSKKEANYIPFGVYSNRSCPAQRIALISMKKVAQIALKQFEFSSSAAHTRSLPNRGPCFMVARKYNCSNTRKRIILTLMKIRDQWEDVYRSILQLFLGTYMVWDARRLRLCDRYFESDETRSVKREA